MARNGLASNDHLVAVKRPYLENCTQPPNAVGGEGSCMVGFGPKPPYWKLAKQPQA
jgi:hypothetical protein